MGTCAQSISSQLCTIGFCWRGGCPVTTGTEWGQEESRGIKKERRKYCQLLFLISRSSKQKCKMKTEEKVACPSAEVRDLLFQFGQKLNHKSMCTSDMQFRFLVHSLEFALLRKQFCRYHYHVLTFYLLPIIS